MAAGTDGPAVGRGSASRQIATFHVGPLYVGIDVSRVQEVLRYQPLSRVPLAPVAVVGLLNLRGQIVTAIDLRRCFGMPARRDGHVPMHIVIRTAEGAVCLLVDAMDDVVDLSEARWSPTPESFDSPTRELVSGVYTLEDRLLLLLDHERAAAVIDHHGERDH